MRTTLSRYKFKRLARESLRNSLRLHSDAILLYENSSYPSAFQLAVLALEELAKAKWVSHYCYTSITNEGFSDADFEQPWLALLYSHTEKQYAFLAREVFDYSPKLVKFVKSKKLELKKQQSIYVSLDRMKNKIDVTGRISIPERIKDKNEFLEIFNSVFINVECFGVEEVDSVINSEEHQFLFTWPHKTGLKSRHFLKQHIAIVQKDSSG